MTRTWLQRPALGELADVATGPLVANQELVTDGTRWFNISHRYRPQGYAAFTGDGSTDDSTALNAMMADVNSAGRGYVEFPNKTIVCKNVNLLQPNTVVDLNGAILTLPSGAGATDDVARSQNFTSLTGTSNTTNSGTPAPYAFKLMNGTIDTGTPPSQTQPSGRHALAIFGMGYTLENLLLIEQACGSALWEEYGNNGEDWSTGPTYRKGDTSRKIRGLTIIDAPNVNGSAPARVTTQSANDMSINVSGATIAGGVTLTVTTARNHWLISNMTATLASIGGITGAAAAFTVTVTGPTTFTVTGTFGGAYTSGGTVTYHVGAAWAQLGPHDSYGSDITLVGAGSFDGGRRGMLCGNGGNAGSGSSTGSMYNNVHIYGNFDVGFDSLTGGVQLTTAQVEGQRRCMVQFRNNGGNRFDGRIFGGQGGVTLLALRDANGNFISAMLIQGASGNGPPAGFTYAATYLDTFNSADNILHVRGSHDFNTTAAASVGTLPTRSIVEIDLYFYAASSAATTGGYLTTVIAGPPPLYGNASLPSALAWTNN